MSLTLLSQPVSVFDVVCPFLFVWGASPWQSPVVLEPLGIAGVFGGNLRKVALLTSSPPRILDFSAGASSLEAYAEARAPPAKKKMTS